MKKIKQILELAFFMLGTCLIIISIFSLIKRDTYRLYYVCNEVEVSITISDDLNLICE